jgi:hypothetical protein
MIREWLQEVLYDLGSAWNVLKSVRNSFGHKWKVLEGAEGSAILWNVPKMLVTTQTV